GTIDADQGPFNGEQPLRLTATGWSNLGTLEASNGGILALAGSLTNSGTITGVSGIIILEGTLNNSNSTLTLNDTTGPLLLYPGGTNGGTVVTTGGAALIASNPFFGPATLAGVTLAGTLDVATYTQSMVNVTGGLTLKAGVIKLGASS